MRLCNKQLSQLAPVDPPAGLACVSCSIADQFQQTRAIVPWRVNLGADRTRAQCAIWRWRRVGEYSAIRGFLAIKALIRFGLIAQAARRTNLTWEY